MDDSCTTGCNRREHIVTCPVCGQEFHYGLTHSCSTANNKVKILVPWCRVHKCRIHMLQHGWYCEIASIETNYGTGPPRIEVNACDLCWILECE